MERNRQIKIELETAFGTYNLTGADVVEKSLKVKYGVVSGTAFSLGGIVAADLSVSIVNADGRFDEEQLNGAILRTIYWA